MCRGDNGPNRRPSARRMLIQINRGCDYLSPSAATPLRKPAGGLTSVMGQQRPTQAFRFHVRFSNRPFGVKRFQTIHRRGVDVAHGLVLLFGIGTRALPSWDSKTRWNNLLDGLAVRLTEGPSGHANSPHPSSREGHHATARWSSSFLLSHLIVHDSHAAATSRVQRNSVPSTQIMVWTGRAPTE